MNNIYRAQFALAPSFDANAFMTIIKNWLDGIENCPIKFDYDMSLPEYHFTDEKGGASLLVCNYQDTPALLLESIIPDRYSLTVTADLSQMSMRVDCTYDEADEHAVIAPVPDFVKLLAWNGYMRQEHGLTPATPMYVTSLNANEFANVLLKQANISSPLIYISASQTTSR